MFPRLRSFLTTLTQRKRFEDSLYEEVRFHLDAQTEDLVRTGVPPEEAARRARVLFGSIEAMKDDCRRARGLRIARPWKQLYLRGAASKLRPPHRVRHPPERRRGRGLLTTGGA